jgi:nitrogen fixation protein FixH
MTAIMFAFFGVIIAVNLTMATLATRTFGGKVVENSYVASQKFNGWLEAARRQDSLGWKHDLSLAEDRKLAVTFASADVPLRSASVTGSARHPVGRQAEVQLRFFERGAGRYESDRPLPPGRWYVHLEVARGTERAKLIEVVQ